MFVSHFECKFIVCCALVYYTKGHKTFTHFCNTAFYGNM